MILCVAGSPSIDKLFEVARLLPGTIHRPVSFTQVPGGKGLNVARASVALGEAVVASGLLAGPAGRWIAEHLNADGVRGQFVWVDGQTRSSLSVADHATYDMTEFYEEDSAGTEDGWQRLEAAVAPLLAGASWCVLAGSLPRGAPMDGYARLIRAAGEAGTPTALDVRGAALAAGIPARPSLVKINLEEAGELLARSISGLDAALHAADEIRVGAGGAGHAVVITLGLDGAVLIDPDGRSWHGKLDIAGRYPVGCGDVFLAGLVAGRSQGVSWPLAMARALGAAAANAEMPGAGRFDPMRALELATTAEGEIHPFVGP